MEKTHSLRGQTGKRVAFWVLTAIAVSEIAVLCILVVEGLVLFVSRGNFWPWLLTAIGAGGAGILGYLGYRLSRAAYRRRFRFSLRALLIAITLLALLLATAGREGIDAWRHHSSYRAIITSGGRLYQQEEAVNGAPFREPGWLESRLGDDPAGQFDRINLGTDQSLRSMATKWDCFSDVEHLILSGPGITDRGVDDARELARLPRLCDISIIGAAISDDGLRSISMWSRAEGLCINDCGLVTDEGLAHLKRSKRLKRLWLVAESGGLNVSGTGLLHLRQIPTLESLILIGLPITDGDLGPIAKLGHLNEVYLVRTGVTASGVRWLQTALPNCTVTFRPTATSALTTATVNGASR